MGLLKGTPALAGRVMTQHRRACYVVQMAAAMMRLELAIGNGNAMLHQPMIPASPTNGWYNSCEACFPVIRICFVASCPEKGM